MSSIKINWRRLIVNRILITAVAIIAQAAWVVVSIFALAEYSQPMSILLRIISLVAVLFIIGLHSKGGERNYSIYVSVGMI